MALTWDQLNNNDLKQQQYRHISALQDALCTTCVVSLVPDTPFDQVDDELPFYGIQDGTTMQLQRFAQQDFALKVPADANYIEKAINALNVFYQNFAVETNGLSEIQIIFTSQPHPEYCPGWGLDEATEKAWQLGLAAWASQEGLSIHVSYDPPRADHDWDDLTDCRVFGVTFNPNQHVPLVNTIICSLGTGDYVTFADVAGKAEVPNWISLPKDGTPDISDADACNYTIHGLKL